MFTGSLFRVLLLVRVTIISAQVIPYDTYKILYEKDCGLGPNGTALITVRTDMPDPEIYAECANGEYNFTIQSEVRYDMVVYYHDTPGQCVFNKMTLAEMYYIMVYTPPVPSVFTYAVQWTQIQCTFDPTKHALTDIVTVTRSDREIETIDQKVEQQANTTIELYVADMEKNRITGRTPIGRYISLEARMLEPYYPKEISFQVAQCRVTGGGMFYTLLSGGCGDGAVIPETEGFTTTGRTASSVLFESFALPGTSELKFECLFAICRSNCDGSSCNARRKRSILDKYDGEKISAERLVRTEKGRKKKPSSKMTSGTSKKYQSKTAAELRQEMEATRIKMVVIFTGAVAAILILVVLTFAYYRHINAEIGKYRKLNPGSDNDVTEEMMNRPQTDCKHKMCSPCVEPEY